MEPAWRSQRPSWSTTCSISNIFRDSWISQSSLKHSKCYFLAAALSRRQAFQRKEGPMSYGHTSPDSHSKEKNYFQPAVRALLVAVCLMLLLITSACKKDPKVEADKHFQRAQQFLKDSKKDEALIEFRRVLQYQPKMASAHFEIAKLQLER